MLVFMVSTSIEGSSVCVGMDTMFMFVLLLDTKVNSGRGISGPPAWICGDGTNDGGEIPC